MFRFKELAISGTRLWSYPFTEWNGEFFSEGIPGKNSNSMNKENLERIRKRELERLKLNLSMVESFNDEVKIFVTHFPPVGSNFRNNVITKLLSKAGITICVFGHLHHIPKNKSTDRTLGSVRYIYTSSDYLNFNPKLIYDMEQDPYK